LILDELNTVRPAEDFVSHLHKVAGVFRKQQKLLYSTNVLKVHPQECRLTIERLAPMPLSGEGQKAASPVMAQLHFDQFGAIT
jgi:hypothetical protein